MTEKCICCDDAHFCVKINTLCMYNGMIVVQLIDAAVQRSLSFIDEATMFELGWWRNSLPWKVHSCCCIVHAIACCIVHAIDACWPNSWVACEIAKSQNGNEPERRDGGLWTIVSCYAQGRWWEVSKLSITMNPFVVLWSIVQLGLYNEKHLHNCWLFGSLFLLYIHWKPSFF